VTLFEAQARFGLTYEEWSLGSDGEIADFQRGNQAQAARTEVAGHGPERTQAVQGTDTGGVVWVGSYALSAYAAKDER
jgi:hypothetical protein